MEIESDDYESGESVAVQICGYTVLHPCDLRIAPTGTLVCVGRPESRASAGCRLGGWPGTSPSATYSSCATLGASIPDRGPGHAFIVMTNSGGPELWIGRANWHGGFVPLPTPTPAGDKPLATRSLRPHYIPFSPPLWIPAFAGMTNGAAVGLRGTIEAA